MRYLVPTLLFLAFALIFALVGGTRLLYCIPSCGILALASLLSAVSLRKIKSAPDIRCLVACVLFALYIGARAWFSRWPFLAANDLYTLLGCLLVYLLTSFIVSDTGPRLLVIAGLLLLALVDVFVGLKQFHEANGFMLFGFIREDHSSRASGMFISGDHLAFFLEIVGILATSLAFWGRVGASARIAIGWAALCCYVGLAFTASRGGYLSALASLATFAVLSLFASRRAARGKAVLISVLATLLVGAAVGGAFNLMSGNPFLKWRLSQVTSDSIRISLWKAGLAQFRGAPIFGTGAGSTLIYERRFRRPEVQGDPVHAHNDYIELLAEYGIVGALITAAFFVVHLAHGWRTLQTLARERLGASPEGLSTAFALQLGALSAMAALLVHSLVDFNLHIPANAMLVAFVLGILSGPDAKESSGERTNPARLFGWALPALGFIFLAGGFWRTIGYASKGLPLRARGAWTMAMILPQMPAQYWIEQARVALRDKQIEQAIALAKKAREFDPRDPVTYFYEGEARRATAVQLSTLRPRGLERPAYAAAVEVYRRGLQIFPEDVNMLTRMAQSLDGAKQFNEAEKTFLTALRHDPENALIHAYYGAHLRKVGRRAESDEQYRLANRFYGVNLKDVGKPELGNP